VEGIQLIVTPELAQQLLSKYPSLARHACKSARSPQDKKAAGENESQAPATPAKAPVTFGDRLVGALLPHAVEHMTLELLTQAHPGEVFAGATTWVSRKGQCMRVRISRGKTVASEVVLDTLSEATEQLNVFLVSEQRQME